MAAIACRWRLDSGCPGFIPRLQAFEAFLRRWESMGKFTEKLGVYCGFPFAREWQIHRAAQWSAISGCTCCLVSWI